MPKTSLRQINPNARTITKNLLCRRHEAQEEKNLGLTKTELRAKLGDEFFQDGLDCGDIIENKKDKLFYMRSAEHRKEKGSILEHNAILEYTVPDHADFVGIAAGFIEEHLMFDDDDTHARSSRDPCPTTVDRDSVSDELLGKVQKTYDGCARLRSNVSHCGQELVRVVGLTPDGVETVKRGLALSKKMLEANAIV